MKKCITFLAVLLILVLQGFSQPKSPRLILVEEFTNASCGPCAAYNPAFNTLLQQPANAEKLVAIKYQTNWPGFDPMNVQTQAEVGPRVTYYAVSGVPDAVVDGNTWHGNPANFTQTQINNAYAVASPFTISVEHNLSVDYDSIYITVIITATDAISGTLVAHCAILEDQIDFATAPGSNGETDFYNVMRKMLPGAAGTTLPGTWDIDDADTLTFAIALPTYIYNLDQISVIAWVQDNATKNVKQAGVSPSNTVGTDCQVESVTGFPVMTCTLPLSALAVIKNSGTVPITECVIKWQMDNDAIDSLNWTGNMAVGDTFHIRYSGITPSFGNHQFKVWVDNANNHAVDIHMTNNLKSINVIVPNQSFPVPIASGFEPVAFPPTNWFIVNPGNDGYKWVRYAAGGFGQSTASARISFYSIPSGVIDELYLPPADFSASTAAALTFSVAHARYSASYSDRLKVMVSTDCGATWNTPYNKADPELATTTTLYTASYVPTAAQWRAETVDMSDYVGEAQVMVKFVAVSGYGNNLYIDDVNLVTNASIHENDLVTLFDVYPNPFNTMTNISLTLAKSAPVSLEVFNTMGQLVYSNNLGRLSSGNHQTSFSASDLSAGLYFLNLVINGEKLMRKITITK